MNSEKRWAERHAALAADVSKAQKVVTAGATGAMQQQPPPAKRPSGSKAQSPSQQQKLDKAESSPGEQLADALVLFSKASATPSPKGVRREAGGALPLLLAAPTATLDAPGGPPAPRATARGAPSAPKQPAQATAASTALAGGAISRETVLSTVATPRGTERGTPPAAAKVPARFGAKSSDGKTPRSASTPPSASSQGAPATTPASLPATPSVASQPPGPETPGRSRAGATSARGPAPAAR